MATVSKSYGTVSLSSMSGELGATDITITVPTLPSGAQISSAYVTYTRAGEMATWNTYSKYARVAETSPGTTSYSYEGNTLTLSTTGITSGASVKLRFQYRSGESSGNKTYKWSNVTLVVEYTAWTKCSTPTDLAWATPIGAAGNYTLTWTASTGGTNNPVTKYSIYRATSSTGTYTALDETTTNSISLASPAATGTTYYFKVQAIGSVSGYDSDLSSSIAMALSVSALSGTITITNVASSMNPGASFTLNWTSSISGTNNSVDYYEIYREQNYNSTLLGTAASSATSLTVYTSRDFDSNDYIVKAIAKNDNSSISSAALTITKTTSAATINQNQEYDIIIKPAESESFTITGTPASATLYLGERNSNDNGFTSEYSSTQVSVTQSISGSTLTLTVPASWGAYVTSKDSNGNLPTIKATLTVISSTGTIDYPVIVTLNGALLPQFNNSLTAVPIESNGTTSTWSDIYIATKNKAKISTKNITAQQSATITSVTLSGILFDDGTDEGGSTVTYTTVTNNVNTKNVLQAGTITITLLVEDSRGNTNSTSIDITAVPKVSPYITFTKNPYRCDSTGTEDEEGTYLNLGTATLGGQSYNNHNTYSCAVSYREAGAITWNSIGTFASNTTINALTTFNVTATDYLANTYELQYLVTDGIGDTSAMIVSVDRATYVFHISKTGNAWAFGGIADTENALHVYGNVIANNLSSVVISASEPATADLWIDTSSSPLLDYIYPVGSIYMNTTLVNPAILFGGTWARIEDTFLLAAGSSYAGGTTGGNATHTLTIEEMPSHTHGWKGIKSASLSGSTYTVALMGSDSYTGVGGPQAAGGDSNGNTVPFNIVPPYLVVYVWQRTA